ncbi:MAG: cytochrome c [Bryobacterales bacterium]|nr:cytochrome c [Bryobacterales bacterium]MBV9399436.1 cytochrome c [Bryobacterales bacterium]
MTRMFIKAAAAAALFALGVLAAWGQTDPKDLYLDKCASCHGADGAGKTAKGKKLNVRPVKEAAAKSSAADMEKTVENGKGVDMPAYGKELSKEQIKGIVEYYRSLAK